MSGLWKKVFCLLQDAFCFYKISLFCPNKKTAHTGRQLFYMKLSNYAILFTAIVCIMVEASYIDGFKTGARFMMEILDDTRENVKPVTE